MYTSFNGGRMANVMGYKTCDINLSNFSKGSLQKQNRKDHKHDLPYLLYTSRSSHASCRKFRLAHYTAIETRATHFLALQRESECKIYFSKWTTKKPAIGYIWYHVLHLQVESVDLVKTNQKDFRSLILGNGPKSQAPLSRNNNYYAYFLATVIEEHAFP